MSDLQNQTPADTYKGLLQVGDYTDGITNNTGANALQVTDGAGVNTALALSTTRVGIGVANNSPQAELDVSGGIVSTTLTTSGAVTGGSVSTSGAVTGGSVSTSGAVTAGSVSTSGAVGAGSIDVSGNVVAHEYALDQTGTSSSAVAIHAPTSNELAIRTNSIERVRIDSAGNCGIGTTSPNISEGLVGSTALTISANSNDDGNKSSALELRGTRTSLDQLVSSVQVYNNSGTTAITNIKSLRGNSDTEGELEFVTSNSPAMRIDSDGKVGIGTTSISAPLEISSTTGGVIMPRMNTTQRTAISSPTPGEMVYDTDLNKFYGYTNTGWVALH